MRVSIIIPALNEAPHIAAAVESAHQSDVAEVIVADGGSHDQTATLAAEAGAIVLESARGRGLQQNAGAAQATGSLLMFLHADTQLGPDCVSQAMKAMAKGHQHGAFRQRIAADGIAYRLLEHGNAARVRFLGLPYGDQAIFIRRELFEAAGGFPNTPIMEDWLLMKRLRSQHWPALLPGPVHTSARRWQQNGILRQTMRNWSLSWAATLGADPNQLAKRYPPHQQSDSDTY